MSLSSNFSTLPIKFLGSASMKMTSWGCLNQASLPSNSASTSSRDSSVPSAGLVFAAGFDFRPITSAIKSAPNTHPMQYYQPMSDSELSQDQMPELALTGVTRRFDDSFSLKKVGFSVSNGESVVLIGPSASGKTVTLKTIAGLFHPDSGSIQIRGHEMTGLSGRERDEATRMGMLFQRSALFDSLTVWENITFRLRQNSRISKDEAIELAHAKLAAVGLGPETALLYPVELSGGMQKRVGIARALSDEPEILLLDEPTAGLDPIMTNVINDLILENVRDLGATVVSITSNLDGARHIADRIIMMNEGETVWEGTSEDLNDSGNPYVDHFVHKTTDGPIGVGLT